MKVKPASRSAYKLLHNGTRAMAIVESNGMRIHRKRLRRQIRYVESRVREIEDKLKGSKIWRIWCRRFGRKANLNSPKQLKTVIFEELGYKPIKKTDAAKLRDENDSDDIDDWSADEAAFAHIDISFLKKYFRRKKYDKVKGTYLNGILRELDAKGILRPNFDLHTAITYRGSSSNINFQNIPVRDPEFAEIIRSCFIPRKNRVLVEIDFSGIEVRVAACYHKDPTMLKYIKDPTKDMHRDMAMQIFFLDLDQVTKMTRYCAKNMFVFPQFYGDFYINSARALWEAIDRLKLTTTDGVSLHTHLKKHGITELGDLDTKREPRVGTFEKHIKDIERHFWKKRFPVYDKWKKTVYKKYQRTGGIHTLTGFTVEGIFERNKVINNGIQGSAFHCELWSLIQLNNWLRKTHKKSQVIGHIHDSIIGDVHVSELQEYLTKAKNILTKELPKEWDWIIVPLEVEVEVTPVNGNWYQKKPWLEINGTWQQAA